VLTRVLADGFDLPAARFGVAAVHAQQIAGKDGGLIPAGAGADLQINVALIARVARQQQLLQFGATRLEHALHQQHLFLAERTHARICVAAQGLRRRQLLLEPAVVGKCYRSRLQARVFHR